MRNLKQFVRTVAFAFSLSVFFPVFQAFADQALGVSLAQEGRCEAALKELEASRPEGLGAEAERLLGECALRLQRFDVAIQALEAARALDANAPSVALRLAMAHYHRGDLDRAEEELRKAETTDASAPEFLLYSGLVSLARADYAAAVNRFDAASRLSDRAPEPMASFYLGRALSELDEAADAESAFGRVIEDHPDSPWAAEAKQARDRLREAQALQWWASAELGYEYDDNVLLRGRSVGLPAEISGQSDDRGFWFFDLGAMKPLGKGFRGGAILRYGGLGHRDLDTFDQHTPGATLWLDRQIGEKGTSVRLQYDIDAAYIDGNSFVQNHALGATVFQPWAKWGHTTVTATLGRNDYDYRRFDVEDADPNTLACPTATICSPFGVDERDRTNRTGNGVSIDLGHFLPLPFKIPAFRSPWIRGGYAYQRYWSVGSEYDHQRNQVELEAGIELPLAIQLKVGGRFAFVAYDNSTVFPDPPLPAGSAYTLRRRNRRERETGVWVVLEREIFDQVVLGAQFRRTRNHSNAEVFDYDRNIFGVSARFVFGG